MKNTMLKLGGHRKNSECIYAEIDDDDVNLVSKYNWTINKSSSKHTHYAYTKTHGERIHLHRLIMGLGPFTKDRRIVNHKDGNGLNNKKSNLEICDFMFNNQSFNTRKNVGCVYKDKTRTKNCWSATVRIYGKVYRKRFQTEEEAKLFIDSIVKEHVKPKVEPEPEPKPDTHAETLNEIRVLFSILQKKIDELALTLSR